MPRNYQPDIQKSLDEILAQPVDCRDPEAIKRLVELEQQGELGPEIEDHYGMYDEFGNIVGGSIVDIEMDCAEER